MINIFYYLGDISINFFLSRIKVYRKKNCKQFDKKNISNKKNFFFIISKTQNNI